jgi:dynein heavy chain 2
MILSWFHSLIQERRTYIPQGWVKYYEFSFGDLKAGEMTLTDIEASCKGGQVQWQKVHGILENAIYGGRVDNDFDMRVLRRYMERIFNDQTLSGQVKLSDIIQVPQSGQVRDCVQQINMVPEQQTPSIFGLPANIDRSVQRFNSMLVINQLKSLQSISSDQIRFDKDQWNKQLSPILQLWVTIYKKEEFRQIKIT